MYYNKSYLGKTSYSIVSDIGKYASGHQSPAPQVSIDHVTFAVSVSPASGASLVNQLGHHWATCQSKRTRSDVNWYRFHLLNAQATRRRSCSVQLHSPTGRHTHSVRRVRQSTNTTQTTRSSYTRSLPRSTSSTVRPATATKHYHLMPRSRLLRSRHFRVRFSEFRAFQWTRKSELGNLLKFK